MHHTALFLLIQLFLCLHVGVGLGVGHKGRGLGLAQQVKYLPAMQETQVPSMGPEDPLKEEMATHSSILSWKIPLFLPLKEILLKF